jgi:hypothetical protein
MRTLLAAVVAAVLVCAIQLTTVAGAPGQRPRPPQITFSDRIAPILYANCVSCHRPGEAAPFSLISFEDVRARARLIAQVTASRYMPPWRA